MKYYFEREEIEYCGQCPCFNDDGGGCLLGYKYISYNDEKPPDCPLKALEAYQPWISVNDRLPTKEEADKDGIVLTYDSRGTQESFVFDEIESWNRHSDNKITHWMPIPDPPRGDT